MTFRPAHLISITVLLAVGCAPGRGAPVADERGATAAQFTDPSGDTVIVGTNHVAGLTMGAEIDEVIAAVSAVLGPAEQDGVAACPGGSDRSIRWAGGLQVQASAGSLAGWVWHGRGAPPTLPITTERGIALGDPVGALITAHGDGLRWFPESTLGVEFFIGADDAFLGGLATGTSLDDTVTAFFAGDSCSYR